MLAKKSLKHFLVVYALITTGTLLAYLLYVLQIQITNDYLGMKPIDFFNVQHISIFLFLSLIVTLLIPKRVKPSGIFVGIYLIFVVAWNTTLYDVAGKLDFAESLIKIYILLFPVISLYIFEYLLYTDFFSRLKFPYIPSTGATYVILIVLLILAALLAYKLIGGGSFDLSTSYERRMAARVHLGSGTVYAYLFAMSLNGIAPVLAFVGVYRNKPTLLLISLAFAIFAYWLIGTKAPIFYVLLMGFFGYLVTRQKEDKIILFLLSTLLFLIVLSLIEYAIFHFSVIADLFVRRAIVLPVQNQSYFIDYMFRHFTLPDYLYGVRQSKPITYIIGGVYYDNPNANINTNAFLYALLQKGIAGYLFAVTFVSMFFLILDVLYFRYKLKEVMAIAILYALLLCEQAYTTAFVTSGIALVFVLFAFFRPKRIVSPPDKAAYAS